MKTHLFGLGTLVTALLFAAALPFVAHAGNTLKIASPADGSTVYSDSVNLMVVTGAASDTVQVYLNGAQVPGFTAPTGVVNGLKEGKNTIEVVAGELEASVAVESEP